MKQYAVLDNDGYNMEVLFTGSREEAEREITRLFKEYQSLELDNELVLEVIDGDADSFTFIDWICSYSYGKKQINEHFEGRTETMKTKDEERKALEQIKKILEDMGPDSYIGWAFDGCIEDAERNIEEDFANSYKSRYEVERDEHSETKVKLELANQEIVSFITELEALQARTFTPAELDEMKRQLFEYRLDINEKMTDAAEKIVFYADKPESENFLEAVVEHRCALKKSEKLLNLEIRIKEVRERA